MGGHNGGRDGGRDAGQPTRGGQPSARKLTDSHAPYILTCFVGGRGAAGGARPLPSSVSRRRARFRASGVEPPFTRAEAVDLQENVSASVGRPFIGFFEGVGQLSMLLSRSLGAIFTGRISPGETLRQMSIIGVNSLPIVLITICFSGMVLALNTVSQFHKMGGDQFVGGLVAVAMARELAPVLASVVVAARVGSAIAAELGSMKVTEQIDALRALAVSPVQYLVVPRLLAAVLMMPVVTSSPMWPESWAAGRSRSTLRICRPRFSSPRSRPFSCGRT